MQVDSFSQIVGRVQLRVPQASRFLCEDWVRNAFREVAQTRLWSWLRRFDQFLIPQSYNTGTVTTTRFSPIITGSGTAWTSDMIGRQFRIASNPIYTIVSVDSTTQITLDKVWGGATASVQTYEIYLAYVTCPVDFRSFIVVYDPSFNWRLLINYTDAQLDQVDAMRSNTGNAYLLAFHDYTADYVGAVAQPVQVFGAGPSPGSAGTYTGPNDAVFTIEITTGGSSGTAVFRWKKDGGSYTSSVLTDSGGSAQDLQDGVQVYFPLAQTYVLGDLWVIRATAKSNPGRVRQELWPHQKSQYVYPYFYNAVPPDISEPGAVLPRFIEGNLLMELALAEASMWPGPSADKPNPMYRLELSDRHRRKAMEYLMIAERNDEEVSLQDVMYQEVDALPFIAVPAIGDSGWLQRHDL